MEKKLKIAFLSFTQGRVTRGSEIFVAEVSKRLSKKHKVDVIAGNQVLAPRWPILWRVFLDPQGLMILWWTLRILPKLFRERYNVVIPLNGGWQPAFVRLITWLYGGKMIISGQSGVGWDDKNNLWCFPDYFVATSSKARLWAKKINPWVKVPYIPNGVDLRKFKPEGDKFSTKLKNPLVICVGALIASKRINLVIEAVSMLKNVSLLVVGDGPLREEILDLGKSLLGERFELVSVKYKDMQKVYRAGDAFCLVSWQREAFGIVYLEAMASGLPVVASNDEPRKEIIGDAGVLISSPEDVGTLVRAIEKVLKRKWFNKPRRQAEKFSWDKIAKSYEELMLELF